MNDPRFNQVSNLMFSQGSHLPTPTNVFDFRGGHL
jgi:hypothetical protein